MNLKDNFLKEFKTTFIGMTLFLVGLGMLVYEIYLCPDYSMKDLYPAFGVMASGIMISFAADRVINLVLAYLKKKFVGGDDAQR